MNDMDFKRQGKDVLCTGELLLARLMGQYCLAGWLLLSSSNAAGGWAGQPPGAWTVGRPTLNGGPCSLVTSR